MAGQEKSDGAFRTIREVADWLGVPTHVLRFWESKFEQIAPVKGAGGRRYYRPEDMRLLGGIKVMLHDQGLPIRGVGQKIDEDGVEAVMALSPDLDMADTAAAPKTRRVIRQGEDGETATVVPFDPGYGTAGKGASAGAAGASPPEPVAPPEPPPPAAPPTEPEEPAPGQPGDEIAPDQLGDESDPPQPSDLPIEEPLDNAGQPDVPTPDDDLATAPSPEPETPQVEPEITPEPKPVPKPDPDVKTAPTPADPDRPVSVLPGNQRRLRRVIRKLRGLIEEIEAEIGDDAKGASGEPGGA